MAQLLYFLPDLRQAAAESIPLRRSVLKERGLAEIFADVPFDQQPLWELPGRGPDNRAGCLLYYQTPAGGIPRRAEYQPKEQAWTPVGDGSLLWIGIDTAEPPKPEEMARRKQYGGYFVELGDGQRWIVPTIRRPDGSTELPTDMIWDAAGRLMEPIKAAYQAYWEETAEVAQWFFEEAEPNRARALELAVRALSLNYRFGRNEQNILRTIDRETVFTLLAATVEASSAPKKTGQVMSVVPGSPGDSPVIDLPAATCT
jgi:hypothetical protein